MTFLALMRYSDETKKAQTSPPINNINNININNINKKSFYQIMKERIYSFYESYRGC